MTERFDIVVVGGGILGLGVAMTLANERGGDGILLIEKEPGFAHHQTGRNSGVIHAGVYYKPGSLKATMCRAGSASMVAFAEEHGVPYDLCGKLIVATRPDQIGRLDALHERGLQNGLPLRRISAEEALEFEPHVATVGAIHSPTTGIIDYTAVCRTYASLATEAGAELRTGVRLLGIDRAGGEQVLRTDRGEIRAGFVVTCGGLHSDRIARMGEAELDARIVPFRGEYFELADARRELVRGLIYPVPDPDFPFLGVHLTRMIDGSVHAGPNAVLAFAREGYTFGTVSPRDLASTLAFGGFWRLARRHWRQGLDEMRRSLSKKRFAAALAELVPAITAADLVPSEAGVRAQALAPTGDLVDDFLIVDEPGALHVCNAPSPAATASIEIAREITRRVMASAS